MHEVTAAEPRELITVHDLLARGERIVQERTASRTVAGRGVLLTRVVGLGDRAILADCHLRCRRGRAIWPAGSHARSVETGVGT